MHRKATIYAALFHAIPVRTIAQWCLVSRETAQRFKTAKQSPSERARRLFVLHRDGRVLGDEWDGWAVRGGAITDPEGNSTTVSQLRAYAHVWQLARELSRSQPDIRAVLDGLSYSALDDKTRALVDALRADTDPAAIPSKRG